MAHRSSTICDLLNLCAIRVCLIGCNWISSTIGIPVGPSAIVESGSHCLVGLYLLHSLWSSCVCFRYAFVLESYSWSCGRFEDNSNHHILIPKLEVPIARWFSKNKEPACGSVESNQHHPHPNYFWCGASFFLRC